MKSFLSLVLAAAMLLPAVGCASQAQEAGHATPSGKTQLTPLAAAVYPEMAAYPNDLDFLDEASGNFDNDGYQAAYNAWYEDHLSRRQPEGYANSLTPFLTASTQQFLSGADGENRVYAPLNVYLALGMLAELTDGNSRQQILDLLGSTDIEALRAQASALWKANYCDDGATTTILASSLWLNDSVSFLQPTLDILADIYYASTYRGEIDALNPALQNWLNEQTGGLLKEQASAVRLDPETVLALATTIYFRAKWWDIFPESRTQEQTFYAASGEVTCDFMSQSARGTYYWGDQFSATAQRFTGGEAMWFLLPDEGVKPEDLLPQLMDFLLQPEEWENQKQVIVHKTIPKFDVTSQLDLCDGLKALGVTDVFEEDRADFTPLTQEALPLRLSQAQHDARVTIDEEGCTAAAFTLMTVEATSAPPPEEVDFVLNRPFLFAITGYDGLPLFIGVVNQP